MQKLYAILIGLLLTGACYGQTLTQANFTGVVVPQFMASGTNNRLPVMYRATVSGLTANTLYRYYTQGATNSTTGGGTVDFGTTNIGAGNPLLISGTTFLSPSSPGFTTAGNYSTFTTDGNGSYTGWFGLVNSGNARFTAGNVIYPSIALAKDATPGTVEKRYALDQSVTVLAFATAAGATNGTGIYGKAGDVATTPTSLQKDFVALYDNTGAAGRPLAVTYLEDEGLAVGSVVPFYSSSVNAQNGRWGTIIPNNNANGVQAIVRYKLTDGSVVFTNTDTDGIWPANDGDPAANTVNPTGGTTPIVIPARSASLPVTYLDFKATYTPEKLVAVTWSTVAETENAYFAIERSADAANYVALGQVAGKGTITGRQAYAFTDANPTAGWNYYRLRQVDHDGTTSFSRAIAVLNENGFDPGLTLTPNPASEQVRFKLAEGQTASRVSVIGLSGQRTAVPMLNPETLDITHLPAALYLLEVQTTEGRVLRQRLLKH